MSDSPPTRPGGDDSGGPDTGAAEPGPDIDLSEPERPEMEASQPASAVLESGPADASEPVDAPPTKPAADEPAVAPAPTPTAAPKSPPSDTGKPPWMLIGGVAAALVAVVVVILLTKGDGKSPSATSTTSTTAAPINTSNWDTADLSAFQFSIRHPKDWIRLEPKDELKVLLQMGEKSFLGVSVYDVDSTQAADYIDAKMKDATLLEDPTTYSADGYPAVVYIFKYEPTAGDTTDGVVVNYFVVAKSRLYSMTFVVRPQDEINRLGGLISAVAKTFKTTGEKPPTTTTTSTAPGASTTATTAR